MPKITFPDGNFKDFPDGTTAMDVAMSISEGLARSCVAARCGDELVDLSRVIADDCSIDLIKGDSAEGLDILRHSAAHLLAHAVTNLYPGAKPTIGPAVENGFYYDFDGLSLGADDLKKVEEEMKRLSKEDLPIQRVTLSRKEAEDMFGSNDFKMELIDEHSDGEGGLTAYRQGDFVDLCRGPHVPSTGKVKAFRLTKLGGSYWRGDASNASLTRVYGTAFADKKALKQHLHMLEEAEKRDHRKLGRDMDLFSVWEETGPGLPLFHPKGTVIFNELRNYWEELHLREGYDLVNTPHVYKVDLWKRSGHWDHYKENMFLTEKEKVPYGVKPMNCPGHLHIYKAHTRSYRELPIKYGEMGVVYRNELSGTLAGLLRVIKITQDDAHVFCTEKQIVEEVRKIIRLDFEIYGTMGFDEVHIELSTRPEKSMGTDEMWEKATSSLENALDDEGIDYTINPGDGAFYGPKIDFHIKDAIGRTWQCGTIQVDFSMPEKFDLTYVESDGTERRPTMIHRTIYGSLERFIGVLTENYAGKFPLWLSPEQVRVIPVSEKFEDYAREVKGRIVEGRVRVTMDDRSESVSKKVRMAQMDKVPYILVVGEQEMKNGTVNVRTRDNVVHGESAVEDFVQRVRSEIDERVR